MVQIKWWRSILLVVLIMVLPVMSGCAYGSRISADEAVGIVVTYGVPTLKPQAVPIAPWSADYEGNSRWKVQGKVEVSYPTGDYVYFTTWIYEGNTVTMEEMTQISSPAPRTFEEELEDIFRGGLPPSKPTAPSAPAYNPPATQDYSQQQEELKRQEEEQERQRLQDEQEQQMREYYLELYWEYESKAYDAERAEQQLRYEIQRVQGRITDRTNLLGEWVYEDGWLASNIYNADDYALVRQLEREAVEYYQLAEQYRQEALNYYLLAYEQ